MTEERDPPSTRCTFILTTRERQLFAAGVPGDRIELYEEVDGRPTGRIITARILRVARVVVPASRGPRC
jgi:hypothetical protein